jgi:hypothetical protein
MEKADSVLDRMTAYFDKKGSPVVARRANQGYSIIHEFGEPAAACASARMGRRSPSALFEAKDDGQ